MKLKGQAVKKLTKKVRQKMEVTLRRMKKVREKDSANLRTVLEQKLKWAIAEKIKGVNVVGNLNIQVERLNGIIIAIKDILEPQKEEKNK